MNAAERPRERLIAHGPESLKTEELLAVLFGTGRPGCDVVQMSRELLNKYGGLKNLSRAHVTELAPRRKHKESCECVKGIGEAKAVSLLAALELGRRAAVEEERSDTLKSRIQFWARQLAGDEREFIIAVYLDENEKTISDERLSYGGCDGAELDAPYLMRRAVRLSCRSMVLLHNHPSGALMASSEDIRLSRSIKSMLDVLGIDFYGHCVTAGGKYRLIQEDGCSEAHAFFSRAMGEKL